jgi:antibiotic biosynthesis monooxygenase (ABM) superfamily enzyme
MPTTHQSEVTSVICRSIKAGHEKDYDDWLRRYLTFEKKAPGYLGTTIILPGGSSSHLRYIIHRFTDRTSMEVWENSPESQNLLEEANNYSTRHYQTSTGMETWFTLPNLKTLVGQQQLPPPPRWKMAIVVFIAAYIISLLSRSILNPLLGQWPILSNAVIYTAILVVSLTYFAMPIMSRLLRHWLYPRNV